jgi:E1A/CREB-binding protein
MSDCHAAEKLFNVLLADYRTEILPHVVYGWSEASDTEKGILTRMNNFFCGLHFIVGLAECAEATLKLWEETHELAATGKSSGTQRLVRTACKSFHTRGSQQAGCSTQFRTYLRSRGIEKIPLAAFRGNRFNILFYDAAGIYFLKQHMFLYLTTSHGSLNQLLQAVLLDLQVPQYIAGQILWYYVIYSVSTCNIKDYMQKVK